MIDRDYDLIIRENFNTSDRRTRKILLSLNEADQNVMMASLASKLYEKIIAKVDDIDYGTIPASKGDITKIGNFDEMIECISTIKEILNHYKQSTEQVDIVSEAIDNIKASKSIWDKAFVVKNDIAITFYNTITLSIVSAVSLLISSSIDFISEPGNQSFQISFNRVCYMKTKDKLLFTNLEKFNKSYKKGDIKKVMESLNKSTTQVKESTECKYDNIDQAFIESELSNAIVVEEVALTAILGAGLISAISFGILLTLIIPVLQELVNFLYCAKQSVSEYFDMQSKIVQFNAEQLKYNHTKTEKEIKKIHDKQIKIADAFKKISNLFAVKMSKAEKEAIAQIAKDKKEKVDIDEMPPTISSDIF